MHVEPLKQPGTKPSTAKSSGFADLAARIPLLSRLPALGRHLPPLFVSAHIVAALELARHMQWLTPPATLDRHTFAIVIEDLSLRCCFTCLDGSFRPLGRNASQPDRIDLAISARISDFASLARGTMDADTLFFQRRLKIAGDTDLGLIVKNWLDAIERPAWLSRP